MQNIRRSTFCLILAAAAGAALSSAALAETKTYQGGIWHNDANWSPFGEPGPNDQAYLPSTLTGSVFVAGGFDVDAIVYDFDSAGYHVNGEIGSIGRALRVTNFGDATNRITMPNLTGRDFFGQDVLVLDGTPMIVNASIVDDPNVPIGPLDVYMGATLIAPAFHTGLTQINRESHLSGLGAIFNSATVTLQTAPLTLAAPIGVTQNRLPDSGRLNFSHGILRVEGDAYETVESVHVGPGVNVLQAGDEGGLRAIPGDNTITRDNAARGTLTVEPFKYSLRGDPVGRIGNFIPWAFSIFGPVRYDAGLDDVYGSADDFGTIIVAGAPVVAGVDDPELDGTVSSSASLPDFSQTRIRSLNIGEATFHVGGGAKLTLEGGVIHMGGNAGTITGGIGSRIEAPTGRELFINSTFGGDKLISVPLTAGSGLTVSGVNGGSVLLISGPVILTTANNIEGQTTVNGAKLILRHPQAISTASPVRLNHSALDIDYNTTVFGQRIIFDSRFETPLTLSGGFPTQVRINDGATVDFSGTWEGSAFISLLGEGSTFRYSATAAPLGVKTGQMVVVHDQDNTFEVTGKFGDNDTRGSVLMNGGTFSGNGETTGDFFFQGGTFSPGTGGGANIGEVKVGGFGMYGGVARFQVNGTIAGTGHDAIDGGPYAFFTGDGSIQISGSLFGTVGTRLDLVSGFGVGITPELVIPLPVQSGARWVLTLDGEGLDLAVAGPVGDANADGTVNITDFSPLAANFNQQGNWNNGDFNGDHLINISDFSLLASNFNTSIPRGAAVPEPTAVAVMFMAAVALQRRRPRRQLIRHGSR